MWTITRASTAPHGPRGTQRRVVNRVRAQKEDGEEEVPLVELRRRAESSRTKETDARNAEEISVNPIDLGRKTREIVDDVWQKFSELGQIMSSSKQRVAASGEFDIDEFEVDPLAKRTTVLVVGATSRVGRVLLRKLVLRGFRVKAFARDPKEVEGLNAEKHEGEEVQDRLATIPPSVEVVFGDVGDPKAVSDAMEGVDKIICCLRSRSTITADLRRVDQEGVANLAKALIDLNHAKANKRAGKSAKSKLTLTKFSKDGEVDKWKAVDLASIATRQDRIFENDYGLKEKVMGFKRAGESALRNSGLGYTIIRPGALIDEPGGQKALIFDQVARARFFPTTLLLAF
eukprot:jgi/Pico_ML_1/53446/g3985.t1